SLAATRATTAKTERTIRLLCEHRLNPSLIVTLHRCNASEDKLPRLMSWFKEIKELGVRGIRLHVMEVDNAGIREDYALSTQENIQAFLQMAKFEISLG